MFGDRFYAPRFFGNRYYGPRSGPPSPTFPAPAVITARVQFAPALAVAAQCAPSITATVTVRP